MLLALTMALALVRADLPPAPAEVRAAARVWRECVSDGLNRRTHIARGGDYDALANDILAECRDEQDAAFAARRRWIAQLALGAAETAAALSRNEREVRSMRDMIVMRARRSSQAYDEAWD
jgi:hypothetical protein